MLFFGALDNSSCDIPDISTLHYATHYFVAFCDYILYANRVQVVRLGGVEHVVLIIVIAMYSSAHLYYGRLRLIRNLALEKIQEHF